MHLENIYFRGLLGFESIYPNNNIGPAIYACLFFRGSFFDTKFWNTRLNGLGHSAKLCYLSHKSFGATDEVRSELFHVVGAAPWIGSVGNIGFQLQVQLSIAGNTCGEIRRQSNGLI